MSLSATLKSHPHLYAGQEITIIPDKESFFERGPSITGTIICFDEEAEDNEMPILVYSPEKLGNWLPTDLIDLCPSTAEEKKILSFIKNHGKSYFWVLPEQCILMNDLESVLIDLQKELK